MWLLMEISSLQNKICFIKYYIKLIKYVQNVSCMFIFLNFGIIDWSLRTGEILTFLQVQAQFKPAFLQKKLILHDLLQPQRTTLSGSGRPASISVIIGVNISLSINDPHLIRKDIYYQKKDNKLLMN